MSSIEPRPNPSPGGNGHGTGTGTVKVAKGVEGALALVQQQLTKQAETVPAPPVHLAPLPVPAAPPPPIVVPPPVPVEDPPRSQARIRPSDDDDDEFWGEPRPRRERRPLDPRTLTRAERRALGRLKARKVRRIVRHVSPWSVFKVSILFYLCLWLILMVAGVILWRVGQDAGVVSNIEKFYAKAAGEKLFEIDGRRVFRAASAAGAILVFAATAFTVLMSILFNLITDLTGGVRLSVLELESTKRDLRGAGGDRLAARVRRDQAAASGEYDDGQQSEGPNDRDLSAVSPSADEAAAPARRLAAPARGARDQASAARQHDSEYGVDRTATDGSGAAGGATAAVAPRTLGLTRRRATGSVDAQELADARPTATAAPD